MDPINDNEKTCKYCNKYLYDRGMNDGNRAKHLQKCSKKVDKSNQNILAFWSNSKTKAISTSSEEETSSNASSDTSSSDTSIENTSSNESLENQTEAFGEISLNSNSESTLTTKYCTGYKIIEIQNLYMEFPFQLLHEKTNVIFSNGVFHHLKCVSNNFKM